MEVRSGWGAKKLPAHPRGVQAQGSAGPASAQRKLRAGSGVPEAPRQGDRSATIARPERSCGPPHGGHRGDEDDEQGDDRCGRRFLNREAAVFLNSRAPSWSSASDLTTGGFLFPLWRTDQDPLQLPPSSSPILNLAERRSDWTRPLAVFTTRSNRTGSDASSRCQDTHVPSRNRTTVPEIVGTFTTVRRES